MTHIHLRKRVKSALLRCNDVNGYLPCKELLGQGLSSVESWFRSGTELFHQVYTYHEVLFLSCFKFSTLNCYLDEKIREKVKHVPSRIQEINHTISQYYLLFLKRISQIVSLFYFSRLLSRCTGKKWIRRTFSFRPGSFREPLLRLTSKQVPLLC